MSTAPVEFALRARLVVPMAGPPLDGGYVTIRGERIVELGSRPPVCPTHDLGDVVILPGLVNAHTHLEFSNLPAPLGRPGMSLPQWIRQVVASRQATGDSGPSAVRRGVAECLQSGTVAIGEIATFDWRAAAPCEHDLPETVCFREAIAPMPSRMPATLEAIAAFVDRDIQLPRVHPALSPHAPYTVHPLLLESLIDTSRRLSMPLAMHLAESREELELLTAGSGPFRELLEAVGAWDASTNARLPTILDYLRGLARAPRSLVVHGNYLLPAEVKFLADHADRMSLIYCPRTHAYFGHDPYPLFQNLAAGVHMALGTDSRASNPDLNLHAEIQRVAQQHPQLSPATILALGTQAGAKALGLDHELGSLAAGKLASLCVIRPAYWSTTDPCEPLVAPTASIIDTWLRGHRVDRVPDR